MNINHFLALGLALALLPLQAVSEEVKVYSARKESLLRPLLDRFTAETGITVKLLAGRSPDLLRRLALEKGNPVADVFIASDAGDLSRAAGRGLLRAVPPAANVEDVNPAYRDPANMWIGMSLRARTLVYAGGRVGRETLPGDYLGLADSEWRGRVCVRSSDSPYNQSMVAALVHHHGAAAVEGWIGGLVANFARAPQGGDRDQIRALAAGVCDLALVNTYYLGIMLNSADANDAKLAREAVALHWLQQGAGVHVNISGMGMVAGSDAAGQVAEFMGFMLSAESQRWFVEMNHEYPVREDVALSETLRAWGEFKADSEAISRLEENRSAAVQLMDRAGWR